MTDHITAEKKLEAAMDRILNGKPTLTDGALTKSALYVEAQVSRATMNRHHELLRRWDEAVALRKSAGVDLNLAAKCGHDALETRYYELTTALAKTQKALRQAESDLSASATVITALYSENLLLKDKLDAIHRGSLSAMPNH